MRALFRIPGMCAAVIAFQSAGHAQFVLPVTCSGITGTTAVAAPESGTVTISDLTKYGVPAQICYGGPIPSPFNFSYLAAMTFADVTKTNCANLNWRINGGPVHVYFTGTGTVDLQAQQLSGTGQGYYQIDNLTVTVNGQNYQVSSDIVQGRYELTATATARQSRFYVPQGGIQLFVNGQPFNVGAELYRCLNADDTVLILQD